MNEEAGAAQTLIAHHSALIGPVTLIADRSSFIVP